MVGAVGLAFTPAGDDVGDTPAEVLSFAEANEAWMVVAMLFALLTLLLLTWFAAGLFARLRDAGAVMEGVLALVGGVVCSVLFFLAITIWSAPLVEVAENRETASTQAGTYLAIDDIGWVALGGSGVAAGLMAMAASLGALRLAAVPAWAGWLGVGLGIAALGTIAFLGLFAWLAWILVVSVALLVPGRTRRV